MLVHRLAIALLTLIIIATLSVYITPVRQERYDIEKPWIFTNNVIV